MLSWDPSVDTDDDKPGHSKLSKQSGEDDLGISSSTISQEDMIDILIYVIRKRGRVG